MTIKDDVREFLITRRAQVRPDQVGLPEFGNDRRVPGLRREEVAMLAGVSLDYYTRLERGNIKGASDSVLNAIASALRLDDIERSHLFDLARRAGTQRSSRTPARRPAAVRVSVQRVLDSMALPAVVYNAAHDIVGVNEAGRALYFIHFDTEATPNIARTTFLDPRARTFYADWSEARRMTAAMLRFEVGRNPLDEELTALIGELSTRSTLFRESWAEHDVHEHRSGVKTFNHPGVGAITVSYDGWQLPGEDGLSIVTYSAEPGSADADRLALLPAWAAQHTASAPESAVDHGSTKATSTPE
ncbi:helix-turn-helix domain-containing protein [Gordonia sp. HNM0687]|uniref:Helix-turn-helix domain-containing protein n=1 Tax=Gordonia mangrovi TaxID=2665643 RepID=A0A6L7GWX7_9ACTN|nr:helix-turn-helix transcriptional regulator [Gordonia mangrovi]MXP23531.1 helix-turn-helix domain-containing protein [Gordonia mangrovi]UVF76574.1 helix-turn-helix transcriptional regulator [Gordonia mangrovi]